MNTTLPMEPEPPASYSYRQLTRTATYGFAAALPLLLLYEGLLLLAHGSAAPPVRLSAEVWLKYLLSWLGPVGWHVLAAAVLLVGIGVYVAERRRRLPWRPRYLAWMVAESAGYAFALALLISGVVGWIFLMVPQQAPGVLTRLALSMGAGLYEELVFRVMLVGGLFALLRRVLPDRRGAYVLAAVVGALLFSAVHYVGALGDAFTLASFTFRFLFGLALNGLFLLRGFGVAAWTHALYDVMVTLHLFG